MMKPTQTNRDYIKSFSRATDRKLYLELLQNENKQWRMASVTENSLLHAQLSYFLWLTSISYLASPERPQDNNELKAMARGACIIWS